ncbi:2-dehydropantoate 2-reductase [Pseudonocardia xinjiangensis]|uniref:2-dehydropantoate 2-reductase n=1 Tax=Pseudonocardia xinjiangensis TaxID=75289 RepID=A0ABX1RJH4_9PSEU|nr:2-dehydropantoate 2-reductase [Pseudonocardia xinjiangensis]NMH80522.1 2-dehydropantoate 2-reductase [Pseudonocardia xinjiangensis]
MSSPLNSARAAAPPETIAVVGTGAVGAALAAWLARAGHRVMACSRSAPERPVVVIDDGDGPRAYPVRWHAAPAQVESTADWVFVATKLPHTPAAAKWLSALVGPSTRIVAAQNGVDHRERFAELTDAPVVPALVYFIAERLAVGSVRVRHLDRGDLVLPDDENGRLAARLCNESGIVAETEPDFTTQAWRKLLINAAANPLTVLTGRRLEVLREPSVAELVLALLDETVWVGRTAGARFDASSASEALAWLRALDPDGTSSMLQDRENNRGLEHEGLTGTVVRLARQHGIPTPVSDTVLALLRGLSTSPAGSSR